MFQKLSYNLKRPMVVAMFVMRMMQSAIHQIIHVVAVWNDGMTAVGAMDVLPVVAFRAKRAFVRVDVADGNGVFIHMVAVRMMQMTVVEIIHVPVVHDGDVSAIFAVDVGMLRMSFVGMRFAHKFYFWFVCLCVCNCIQVNLTTVAAGAARNVSASNLH